MYGYVYKTTNKLNNKIYIGQHKASSFDNSYYGSGTIIQNALNKYGKENFQVEVLYEAISFEDLNDKECFYITYFNSTDDKIGYNIKKGGNCTPCPDYIKKKISKANKGKYKDFIHIHKDDVEKVIPETELQNWLSEGYVIGRSPKTLKSMSENYNYSVKGMLNKRQSDYQKKRASEANSYKRTEEQRRNFSNSKKRPNTYSCLRTPDNKSTIRCRNENIDFYLEKGYTLCISKS